MAIVHAVAALYDAVVARFAVEGPMLADAITPTPNVFGWRTPAQQLVNSNRICWVPGDPAGGLGAFLPPISGSAQPRSLGTVEELFFCDIIAADPTAPENERAQYEATRTLFDYWWRAIYHAAYAIGAGGQLGIVREEWLTEKTERRYGAVLRATCSVLTPVPDMPPDGSGGTTAPADTGAIIDVHELDVTETVIAEPGVEEP